MSNETSCRLCGGKELEEIHKESFLSRNYGKAEAQLEELDSSYYVCSSCGTILLCPLPSVEELDYYYTNVPSTQPHQIVISEHKAEIYVDRIRFLREVTGGLQGHVLEIGAATGAFLAMLRNETGVDVLGIEPSKECQLMAREAYGVQILPGILEGLDLEAMQLVGAFDLTLTMNTLEHVRFPHRFLETMVKTVKPGGYLFVEVPSTEYLARYKSVASGQDINPGHLSHFNGAGLASVLQSLGTTVIYMGSSPAFKSPSLQIVAVKHSAAEMSRISFLKHIELRDAWFKERMRWLEDMLASHKHVAIWGAGTDLHSVMTRYPNLIDMQRCILVDRNPVKQGKTMMRVPIRSPDVLRADGLDVVVITPANHGLQLVIRSDVERHLPGVGCEYLFPQDRLKTP